MKKRGAQRTPRNPRQDPAVRRLAVACARAADAKLGESIVVLDLRGLTPVADFTVIVTATSGPHARALVDAVEEAVDREGFRLHHREGGPESPWVLLDCQAVLVHLFEAQAREYYDLERLWADARRVQWQVSASKTV